MRYFLEDIFLTANYATEHLAMKRLHIAGLSGGGWSTTFAAAMDPRLIGSFPIAGSIPCAMRNPDGKSWPVGNDAEDFEQNCSPNPNPTMPAHPGRAAFQACNYTCTTCTRAPGTAADGDVAASASSHTPPDTSGCWACSARCQWRLLCFQPCWKRCRNELIVKPVLAPRLNSTMRSEARSGAATSSHAPDWQSERIATCS